MIEGPLLVIAHEATRTGSPRVLVELLRYATQRIHSDIRVQLLAQGPLAAELRSFDTGTPDDVAPGAILVNGSQAAGELRRFTAETPSIVYVHEVGEALQVLSPDSKEALQSIADIVLCVSEQSRSDLVALGVDAHRISVLPPPVSARSIPSEDEVLSVQAQAGSVGRNLVLGCGEAVWRKGADLFLQLAAALADDDLAFAWVGRRPRSFGRVLDADSRALGLGDKVHWFGEVESTAAVLAASSILVICSREDPQPLVPLEAALAQTPTVGFSVGGMVDFTAAGAARTVAYPDVAALAHLVREVLSDPAAGQSLVIAGEKRAATVHALDVVGPAFMGALAAVIDLADHPGRRP